MQSTSAYLLYLFVVSRSAPAVLIRLVNTLQHLKNQKNMHTNAEFHQYLHHVLEEKIPFCKLLGMKLTDLNADHPKLTIHKQPELIGNFSQGMLHGGVIASVLDSIGAVGVLLKMAQQTPRQTAMEQVAEFAQMSTIDLRIDFLKPARGDVFIASAEVTRLGRRVANVLMQMHDQEGVRIATGAAAFILHGKG